jgi:hypothetical protein
VSLPSYARAYAAALAVMPGTGRCWLIVFAPMVDQQLDVARGVMPEMGGVITATV